eukprot:6214373-Pleurochrysis_carterae.AAC.14
MHSACDEQDDLSSPAKSSFTHELDFRNEAANAEAFAKSVAYLGYVTVPAPLHEYIPGPRVLVSEWVHGKHMNSLPADQAFNMAAMAVEAVTAGLLLTGIVHADPHEGNIMLDDSGRLVFLDFGLMSSVDPDMCASFAPCHLAAETNSHGGGFALARACGSTTHSTGAGRRESTRLRCLSSACRQARSIVVLFAC